VLNCNYGEQNRQGKQAESVAGRSERVRSFRHWQALCASIISLARTLGLSVVAEGVERSIQRDRLNELGCDYYQGFLFSQPLAVDAFKALLQEQGAHEQLRLDALS